MDIDPPFKENLATAEDWRMALNKVVPAVVVLRTNACRAFDTESAGASYATGFVVDKRRGIILTNRHVVKPGNTELVFLCCMNFQVNVGVNYGCLLSSQRIEQMFVIFVGPVVAEAMFVNREEIPVYPIYRDPVSCLLLVIFCLLSLLPTF